MGCGKKNKTKIMITITNTNKIISNVKFSVWIMIFPVSRVSDHVSSMIGAVLNTSGLVCTAKFSVSEFDYFRFFATNGRAQHLGWWILVKTNTNR